MPGISDFFYFISHCHFRFPLHRGRELPLDRLVGNPSASDMGLTQVCFSVLLFRVLHRLVS